MLRKWSFSLFFTVVLLASCILTAQAQQDTYRLNVQRTFGYGNGSQIRGNFKLDVVGPSTIKSVTYLMDGKIISQVSAAPFSFSFQTSQYAVGWHTLSAEVETQDGQKFTTPARQFEFVTQEQETNGMVSLVLPILGGTFGLIAVGLVAQMLIFRNKPRKRLPLGSPRSYGLRGGGVCPNCHRPFSLHWWAPNLGLRTRFDRCDFCGKWGIIRPLSSSELAAAEAAELQQSQPAPDLPQKTEQDHVKEMIDQSRYTEM